MASDQRKGKFPGTADSDTLQIYDSILEGFEDIAEGRYFESTGDFKKDMETFKKKEAEGWK